ncbi:MAG: DUF4153 domain-containing protein [Treponema sp.]|nr:DUF4153 domain-containing protein [Treponema sp.]
MKFFSSFFKSIKPAFFRFPAVYILSFATTAVYAAWQFLQEQGTNSDTDGIFARLIFALFWACIMAFPAGLSAEKFIKDKPLIRLAVQLFCALCAIPVFILMDAERWGDFPQLCIFSLLLSFIAISPFLLGFTQDKNEIVLNISFSALAAFILMMCFGCALSIIYWAISQFFMDGELSSPITSCIWTFSFFIVFIDSFATYTARGHNEITIPRFCKVVFLYTLFPLYLVLMLVLYAYMAVSIATLSLPMREANGYISFATALFIVFQFTLPYYDCKASRIFRKFGAFALIPLIIVQIIISVDRIHAHGISPARYATVLYTLFSCAVVFLSFYKKGSKTLALCPILACLLIFASFSPLNIINVPLWSQTRIMEKVLNAHGLIEDGSVNASECAKVLSADEKEILVRAYGKIDSFDKRPDWFNENFEKTFGFNRYESDSKDYYYRLSVPSSERMDISSYSEIYLINNRDKNIVEFAGRSFDITPYLKDYLLPSVSYDERITDKKPIYINAGDNFTLIITNLSAYADDVPKGTDIKELDDLSLIKNYGIHGFAVR